MTQIQESAIFEAQKEKAMRAQEDARAQMAADDEATAKRVANLQLELELKTQVRDWYRHSQSAMLHVAVTV